MTDGGWTLVFHDDFESSADSGWSFSTITSCGTATSTPTTSNILGGTEHAASELTLTVGAGPF